MDTTQGATRSSAGSRRTTPPRRCARPSPAPADRRTARTGRHPRPSAGVRRGHERPAAGTGQSPTDRSDSRSPTKKDLDSGEPGDIGDDQLPEDLQPTEDNPLARHPGQTGDEDDEIGTDREGDAETAPLNEDDVRLRERRQQRRLTALTLSRRSPP